MAKQQANLRTDASLCDPAGSAARALPGANTPASCAAGCNHTLPNTCTGTLSFLFNRGLSVVDEAGNLLAAPALGTGAAYIVISPMAEGSGAYSSSGVLSISSVAAGTNGEDRNMNGQAIPVAGFFHDSRILPGASAGANNGEVRNLNNQAIPAMGFFDDVDIRTGSDVGTAHFDDALSYPRIADFLRQNSLAARSH